MPNLLAQLTINMFDNGDIEVRGPVEQMVMCYGLLEVAKDTIRRTHEAKRIQEPSKAEVLSIGGR